MLLRTLLTTTAVKYVALLAFQKIATSHPSLVLTHQDIILGCLDDPDISIRLQALKIGSRMINAENLPRVVSLLLAQLRKAPANTDAGDSVEQKDLGKIESTAGLRDEDPGGTHRLPDRTPRKLLAMPVDYQLTVIDWILEMCGRDSFANIDNFEWYIHILVDLLQLVPRISTRLQAGELEGAGRDVSTKIGIELRNIAVRVPSVRSSAVQVAESLLATVAGHISPFSPSQRALTYAAWIAGEYTELLPSPEDTLNRILLLPMEALQSDVLSVCLQAVSKVLASIFRKQVSDWSSELMSMTSLMLARIIDVLKPLTNNPALEVQERALECLELARLSTAAASSHDPQNLSGPVIMAVAIPSLFRGSELNPVALTAQRKVPSPDDFDFTQPLNANLGLHLGQQDWTSHESAADAVQNFYLVRDQPQIGTGRDALEDHTGSSQAQDSKSRPKSPTNLALGRAERYARYRDDPFYIASTHGSPKTDSNDTQGPRTGPEPDLDVDSIPILELGPRGLTSSVASAGAIPRGSLQTGKRRVHVAAEENIVIPSSVLTEVEAEYPLEVPTQRGTRLAQAALLQVDSSEIGRLDLEGDLTKDSTETRKEEEEMAKALANVERMRMEMQRASERAAFANNVTPDGALIKKKSKKKRKKATLTKGNGTSTPPA